MRLILPDNDRLFCCQIPKAVDRLNEKRTWFGTEALKLVDRFFEGSDYVNNPYAIAKYAQWAIRGDGPSLYSIPTPIDCTVKPGDPGYIVS